MLHAGESYWEVFFSIHNGRIGLLVGVNVTGSLPCGASRTRARRRAREDETTTLVPRRMAAESLRRAVVVIAVLACILFQCTRLAVRSTPYNVARMPSSYHHPDNTLLSSSSPPPPPLIQLTSSSAAITPPASLLPSPPPPPTILASPPLPAVVAHHAAVVPKVVESGAARNSDPRRVPWGANVTIRGPPPAIVFFAPHKTGSTFFTLLLYDLASLLGLCWYTENAGFMYSPNDFSKCASPSCGHAGSQRQYAPSDRGWGDCTPFATEELRLASTCASAATADGTGVAVAAADHDDHGGRRQRCSTGEGGGRVLSAQNGVAWGVIRLPDGMRAATTLLGASPWQWYVVLHSRHPGDTLVSGYHSFGWTHPAAPGATAAQSSEHAVRQAAVRNQTVDTYVADYAAELRGKYAPYALLRREAPNRGAVVVPSKYEDVVTDFPKWVGALVGKLAPSYDDATIARTIRELVRRHSKAFRPDGKHKRSVKPGRFDAEVSAGAAARLRLEHKEWWAELGYAR